MIVLPSCTVPVPEKLTLRGTERRRMLHRRNLRYGQGWRVGNRSYEARKRHENHGDCGSPRIAALGQKALAEPSRKAFGTAMLRLLHDQTQAGKLDRRSALAQWS